MLGLASWIRPAGGSPVRKDASSGLRRVLAIGLISALGSVESAHSATITEFRGGIRAGSVLNDIAAGPDGNMWFTEESGRIGRITPAGRVTEFSSGITAGATPGAIAAGPDGNVWFIEGRRAAVARATTQVGPELAILTRRATVSRTGVARVELTCGSGSGICAGRLKLTVTVRVRQRNRKTKRMRTVTKTISAGSARFSIQADQKATVRPTLGRVARQRLKRSHSGRLVTQARAICPCRDARGRLVLSAR